MADIVIKDVKGSYFISGLTEAGCHWVSQNSDWLILSKIDEDTYEVNHSDIERFRDEALNDGLEIEEEEG